MKKLVFITLALFVDFVVSKHDKITFFDNSENGTRIGQQCSLAEQNEHGTCQLISDCRVYFENSPIIKICGNQNGDQIICCPKVETASKIDGPETFNGFKQFEGKCTVAKTNEQGFLKLIEHCPRIKSEVKAGAPFPRVCGYEVCRDMVCCPIDNNKHRKFDGKSINPIICIQHQIIYFNFQSAMSMITQITILAIDLFNKISAR